MRTVLTAQVMHKIAKLGAGRYFHPIHWSFSMPQSENPELKITAKEHLIWIRLGTVAGDYIGQSASSGIVVWCFSLWQVVWTGVLTLS